MKVGGGERIVRPFRSQELGKCIGCVLSAVTYGKNVHKLWSEIPKYFGKKAPNKLQIDFVGTLIYIRYVVISIIIFTSMLAI